MGTRGGCLCLCSAAVWLGVFGKFHTYQFPHLAKKWQHPSPGALEIM